MSAHLYTSHISGGVAGRSESIVQQRVLMGGDHIAAYKNVYTAFHPVLWLECIDMGKFFNCVCGLENLEVFSHGVPQAAWLAGATQNQLTPFKDPTVWASKRAMQPSLQSWPTA